ncbi:MAG TPA: DUF5666 domain-containing protein, partial [Candidatus Deferrimicrobium sp.]|nr:DUF5666 domain-containing protein [Candidatus Deferrimicrobium sp.]
MNDQTDPTPTEPIAPVDASLARPFPPADPGSRTSGDHPGASFTGRTPRKTAAVRAGMILGTGLLLAIGAAVAMGASPAPSASSGAQTPTMPGFGNGAGPGFEGFGLGPGGRGEDHGFAGGGHMDGRGFGQISITAISGSNISLATADGWKRTIAVTSATTITKGGAAATLADLAVGDTVRFAETRNSDGSWTITAIEIVVPRTAGTVTAVGSDTITITLRDGTSQTIKTTPSTTYHLEQADGKRSDVTVGSSIVASG